MCSPLFIDSHRIGVVGAVAQLVEHLVCNQGVRGSNPLSSTI